MSLIPFAPFFTADFLAAFFALLLPPRPRRLVIGHVLLRGHARNGAADGFYQNRGAGFPRPTRPQLVASRRKVRALRTVRREPGPPTF